MRSIPIRTLLAGLVGGLLSAAPAGAEPEPSPETAEGYCEHVKGVAAAQSVLLWSPELFGNVGYLDQQTDITLAPDRSRTEAVRVTAGLRYRLSGAYEGVVTRSRAEADCRRQRALTTIQRSLGAQESRAVREALLARAQVLDEALGEARGLLRRALADLEDRRTTAPEVTTVRLRVDELRALSAATQRELELLPEPAPELGEVSGALREYYAADAAVERADGKLRRARSWDVNVLFGYDRFLREDDESLPVFAVVGVSYNLGGLWQGRSNRRAAVGRQRFVAQEGRRLAERIELDARRLRLLEEADRRRLRQTVALLADLEDQLATVEKLTGDAARRYRQMLWFEWVKVKAENEYLRAHLRELSTILHEMGAP